MSDELLALLLTLAFFALLAAWVLFLECWRRQWRGRKPKRLSAAVAVEASHEPRR